MELASMLAGERFGDRPRAVCRVIGAFLRAYNDAIDDERRDDLYRCAAAVVGTRAALATERLRRARCERELDALRGTPPARRARAIARSVRRPYPAAGMVGLADNLVRALIVADDGHARAIALVDELAGISAAPPHPCRLMSGAPAAMPRRAGEAPR
jgi:hypothetical protein